MKEFVFSSRNPQAPMAYCCFDAMHTRIELLLEEKDEEKAKGLCREVEDLFCSLEHKLSRHVHGGDLYKLNCSKGPSTVEDEVFFVLELCEQMRKATSGYFDIAALSQVIARPAYTLFPPTHSVERTSASIVLDLGGFAKGYALEKARALLAEAGVENALLNAGNSSVIGLGHHPVGDVWSVSTADGSESFELKDSALSLSGRNGDGHEHIVDPHSGRLVSGGRAIAVTGKSAIVCEVLSTALYAAPKAERAAIMAQFENYKMSE